MPVPVFEDVEPPPHCGCEECARRRLVASVARTARAARHGPATGTARAVVLAAAAGTALSSAGIAAAVPAPARGHATGWQPSHAALPAAPLRLTRAQILERAETWVSARVPYSTTAYWDDGYRQDCSGFVSMAWGLDANAWTGSLSDYAARISSEDLQPGDILLFHNPADPKRGSHAVVFGGWANRAHTRYTGYEQTVPRTRARTIPYPYFSNSRRYLPYRYKYLAGQAPPSQDEAAAGSAGTPGFPGGDDFGPGAENANVTRLGAMLTDRGAGAFYRLGPGPRWSHSDKEATAAFQRAQGWRGDEADGLPGPTTWKYLVGDLGHDVGGSRRGAVRPPADEPPHPGATAFRPGQTNGSVLALGRRLVAMGFGANYRVGPTSTWGEADRRNVEAFQRAQGWSGRKADGYPGPETWRRLFS